MSNRGRQNVASYLALDLQLDWRLGADWFESTLVDYDVCSNWGNWVAAAGMTGGRLNQFNVTKQSKDYDEVCLWQNIVSVVTSIYLMDHHLDRSYVEAMCNLLRRVSASILYERSLQEAPCHVPLHVKYIGYRVCTSAQGLE